ncbi:hypothetical protein ACFL0P_03780 [Candidatus Omnitrophota bacterium]
MKSIVEKTAGETLDKKVSIERMGFLPYGELILHNVRMQDKKSGIHYGFAERCHIRFKIWPLLINRRVVVTNVTLKEPVFMPPFKDLRIPSEKNKNLNRYKLELSDYFLIRVISGRTKFSDDASAPNKIGFSFWVRMAGKDKFSSEGWINLENYCLEDYLLNDLFFFEFIDKIKYQLKATLDGDDLSVDRLLLDFGQFKIGANGVIENYNTSPTLNLKLTLEELGFPEKVYLNSKLLATSIRNLIVHIKGAIEESRWSVSLDSLRSRFSYLPTVLKIDNFYCNLKLSKESLTIEECSCFFNNFPIGLTCTLSTLKSPHIEFNVISHPGQVASLRPLNPLNFEFSFSGYKYDDSVRGRMFFQIQRLISPDSSDAHDIKLTIEDLLCKFSEDTISSSDNKNTVPLLLEARDVVCETDTPRPDMRLDIEEFNSSLHPEGTRIYFSDTAASAYNGLLRGRGFMDFKRLSPHLFFDFEFNEFNMAKLMDVLHLEYDLAGSLSGNGIFNSEELSSLVGAATASNGYIKGLKLLDLIADFLGVMSLKDVYFEDCSSNFSFSADGEQVLFDNIILRSEDIHLDANLSLTSKQKIKGDMLVRLSKALLKESFKLRMLFFLTGESLPYVDFEFKIGGYLASPHIKWLDTRFRKNIMRYLSEGGQKAIETKVEEAIMPLVESK